MSERIKHGDLEIAKELYDLVANEIAPGSGVEPSAFWSAFEKVAVELAPKNKALLAKRDDLQAAMALIRKDVTDVPLSFDNFRD